MSEHSDDVARQLATLIEKYEDDLFSELDTLGEKLYPDAAPGDRDERMIEHLMNAGADSDNVGQYLAPRYEQWIQIGESG